MMLNRLSKLPRVANLVIIEYLYLCAVVRSLGILVAHTNSMLGYCRKSDVSIAPIAWYMPNKPEIAKGTMLAYDL